MLGDKGKKGKKQLTSVSGSMTGGGLGWTRKPGEFEVMHDLFSDVGGLRVLSYPFEEEGEEYVNRSILRIRDQLSDALKRLPKGSECIPNVRSMRNACNAHLQATPGPEGHYQLRPRFQKSLARWRETVYEDIKAIAYGLDLEEAKHLMRDMQPRPR
jgi:hypothetical protein